jgi:hypothetical protein
MIKHFSNKDGIIYAYDKITDKYFEPTTKNVFLENNRNTFIETGLDGDAFEKMYTYLDNAFAPVLEDVNNTANLENNNLDMLLFLAYTTKWRIPQYDDAFKEAKEYFEFNDLPVDTWKGGIEYLFDLPKDNMFYQEMKRVLLALQAFRKINGYDKIFKNSFLINTPSTYPALLGDCPFNEIQLNSDVIFEDFIFPIGSDLTLIHNERIDKTGLGKYFESHDPGLFLELFSTFRDIGTIFLSGRTIICSDKSYLKEMIEKYNKVKDNETFRYHLSTYVFKTLYDYENLQQFINGQTLASACR